MRPDRGALSGSDVRSPVTGGVSVSSGKELGMIVAALPSVAEIRRAASEVYAVMPPTPQFSWPGLNEHLGCEVWVKHENHTPVGAFKIRGGIVYFNRLRERGDVRGVICATRGNHGQSVAFNGARTNIGVTIVVPHGNSIEKNDAMRGLGAKLLVHGNDFQAALDYARLVAAEEALHFVPSYAPELVCGVATYALEFLERTPQLDTIYAPVGLGSGLAGLIAARNGLGVDTELVAVVAEGAPAYAQSLASGHIIEAPADTIADGMACRTPNAEALDVFLANNLRCVRVTDAEIEAAMRLYFTRTHNVAEGAGAASLAAAIKDFSTQRRRIGVVLSGGNVDRELYVRVLSAG
jgi:threonine dehydratase